jgi:hypothetical protein
MRPELKALVDDIVYKYLGYISSEPLKEFIFDLVEKQYNKGIDAGEINFNRNFIPSYETVSFIQKFAFDNVSKITDDVKDNLRKEMSIGLMNGESIPQLRQRIIDVMDATISRAEMITRTESNRAFNMGHYQAARDSGLILVKEWSAQNERISHAGNVVPCPICESLDRIQVDMNDRFRASNGEEYLLPPVHPHCACRVLYVQQEKPQIKAEATFQGKPGKWRTVRGRHIFFADDGTAYGGDGKKIDKSSIGGDNKEPNMDIEKDGREAGYKIKNVTLTKEQYDDLFKIIKEKYRNKEITQQEVQNFKDTGDVNKEKPKTEETAEKPKKETEKIDKEDIKNSDAYDKIRKRKDFIENNLTSKWGYCEDNSYMIKQEFGNVGDVLKVFSNTNEDIGNAGSHIIYSTDDGKFIIDRAIEGHEELVNKLEDARISDGVFDKKKYYELLNIDSDERLPSKSNFDRAEKIRKDMAFDFNKWMDEGLKTSQLRTLFDRNGINYNHDTSGHILYMAHREKILSILSQMKEKWSINEPDDKKRLYRNASYLAGILGSQGLRSYKDGGMGTNRVASFIDDMREYTKNDTHQINVVLKYMGEKLRVVKEGYKNNIKKTAEEVKKSITSHEHAGFKYDIGANFRKSSDYKSDEELHKDIKEALSSLPETIKDILSRHNTKISFVNRSEIKALHGSNPANAVGFYDPEDKQIYMYPAKGHYMSQFLFKSDAEKHLRESGYDDVFIGNLRTIMGKRKFKNTIIHEVGHAVALNDHFNIEVSEKVENGVKIIHKKISINEESLQSQYDDFRKYKAHAYEAGLGPEQPINITRYAGTNSHEDFAEHFAFYNGNKQLINKELEKKESGIFSETQLKKFRWMKEKVWKE